ncbi:glyoxylase-like metal-dependent hydrolase (beta-lactamase superfamily II) [Azospirillum fermentarium]|uniref:MBL fold metallo-hydrolase n=1 Tax=Azospirillum fermentarium TaxID=1233114 RepID=UPI002225C664|nr:MBL fold metallo-hydrolase [Azospirillum fermentarium]MCW2247873.1 glyoxylase-like metal-dependent hydrolase (beta-lactamase superfamily II) [Azospirillum fermentarium]
MTTPLPPAEDPFGTPPPAGTAVAVAPGVWWARMPLPFALNHINIWLLEDGDGWAVVDCGFNDDATRTAWEALFTGPMGGRPVTRVITTHFHPDHMGLAAWLTARFGATFHATLAEWLWGRMLSMQGAEECTPLAARFYADAGLPEPLAERLARRADAYRLAVPEVPAVLHRLRDGDGLAIGGRRWRVVVGRGHAPEQACLMGEEAGVFISGDQVLPKISPNVSVWPQQPDEDPLNDFLVSLEDVCRRVPDSLLVLPSHGRPFHGLHARAAELASHHADRLAEVAEACRGGPKTVFDVMQAMFPRELDPIQVRFAIGEALAHVNHLLHRGVLVREAGVPARYRAA